MVNSLTKIYVYYFNHNVNLFYLHKHLFISTETKKVSLMNYYSYGLTGSGKWGQSHLNMSASIWPICWGYARESVKWLVDIYQVEPGKTPFWGINFFVYKTHLWDAICYTLCTLLWHTRFIYHIHVQSTVDRNSTKNIFWPITNHWSPRYQCKGLKKI